MKILVIIGGFFPGKKFGGPPVSVDNFCNLMRDDQCYIYTYNHEFGETVPYTSVKSNVWIKRDNYTIKYVDQEYYVKAGFETTIREIKPDVLYLQGLFQSCVVPCLQLAKKYNLKVLLAPRGELCAGAFKKKYKKVPYIAYLRATGLLKNVHFQSTSDEETAAVSRYLGARSDRIYYLSNIPSIPKKEYVRKEKEEGLGRFVFLSRIHPKKNLISAIKYFKDIKGKAIFDIYGPIEDKEYWNECRKEIETLPENVTVNYCGLVAHDQVHEVFSKYDAFLFPTFSENYGHVIAESLIVGTPVIISDQTPWNDINKANAGYSIALSNKEQYIEAIQNIINMPSDEFISMTESVKKYIFDRIGLENLRVEYLRCIECVVGERK